MTIQAPKIFCALDAGDMNRVCDLARMMATAGCGIKLGLEFFGAHGPQGVSEVQKAAPGVALFLDLKFHDIPNTVAGAVSSVLHLVPDFITIHAAGGAEMIRAARKSAAGSRTKILAVTMLTSLDARSAQDIGFTGELAQHVVSLAKLAQDNGADGIVCSPHEIAAVRKSCGKDFILMVPGIRAAGADTGDQKRTMGARQALMAGADHLVIGRPITQSENPLESALGFVREAA